MYQNSIKEDKIIHENSQILSARNEYIRSIYIQSSTNIFLKKWGKHIFAYCPLISYSKVALSSQFCIPKYELCLWVFAYNEAASIYMQNHEND